MSDKNLQVVLASRPKGWVEESNFRFVEAEIPQPGEGEILLKTLYLSLDPYMRGRMDTSKSYASHVELGDVMVGGTISEVVTSNNPKFQPGDIVLSGAGWQQYVVSNGKGLRKIEPGLIPLTAYLGTAGMPGVTAWVGLFDIGAAKAGETVVVSAATRIAFRSVSEPVTPHRSTIPSFTVAFSSSVCAQRCALRCSNSLSRMLPSETGISSLLPLLATA